MIVKRLQYCGLALWIILSVGILAWGVWPRALESHNLIVPGFGELTLEWTPENRKGDISVIKLTLSTQNAESLSVGRQLIRSVSYSQNFYGTGSILDRNINQVVEARLEIPSVDLKPRDTVGQTFQPGEEVVFYWNINSHTKGEFRGRIWIYIGNHSLAGDIEHRYPIAVQAVDLKWQDLFGLSGAVTRYIGLFGLMVGIGLVPFFWFRARQAQRLNLD